MYLRGTVAVALLLALQATACLQVDDEATTLVENEQPIRSDVTRLRAGKNLVALGVTEDDFVLYWSASSATVWATPVALPILQFPVARDVTAAPLTLVRGRVAMIWTAQPFLGVIQGFQTVSPLVVWSAITGPRVASTTSLAPQLFSIQASAAVRPDGREVVFTSNVAADGSSGDVVRASTDLKKVTTLVSGIDIAGPCPPHIGYDRLSPIGTARVIVSSCAPGASTATLSRWTNDKRVDLTTSMRAGIWWTSDERGEHVLAQLASNTPAVFTLDNAMTIVDARTTAVGWITRDGTVFQTPLTADRSAREIYRITLAGAASPSAQRVTTLPPVSGIQFANHLPFGVPYANVSTVPTTRSGAFFVAFTAFNDSNGLLTDSQRIDARASDAAPVASSAAPVSLPAFEISTRDERFNLFHVFATDDVTRSVLFAGSATGEARQVSDAQTTLGVFGLGGSRIAFADRVSAPLLDGSIDATGDIVAVDVGAPASGPTVLARGARAHFFVTPSRDAVVYTTDADAAPGLFVRRLAL